MNRNSRSKHALAFVLFAWSSRGTHHTASRVPDEPRTHDCIHRNPPRCEETTLDQLFTCLNSSPRRRILTTLAADGPRDEDEFGFPDFKPDDEGLELFRTNLYHNHLPRLAQAGFIEWDRDSDTITRGPKFEEVRPLITLMNDHQDELPEDWS